MTPQLHTLDSQRACSVRRNRASPKPSNNSIRNTSVFLGFSIFGERRPTAHTDLLLLQVWQSLHGTSAQTCYASRRRRLCLFLRPESRSTFCGVVPRSIYLLGWRTPSRESLSGWEVHPRGGAEEAGRTGESIIN